ILAADRQLTRGVASTQVVDPDIRDGPVVDSHRQLLTVRRTEPGRLKRLRRELQGLDVSLSVEEFQHASAPKLGGSPPIRQRAPRRYGETRGARLERRGAACPL